MRNRLGTDTDGLGFGDLRPGTRIGDYHIVEQLYARGTGIVYHATHAFLPRRVCIKVLPSVASWTRASTMQLLREACIVEALDHPGVARIYESGMLPDRRPWIATEHVDGCSLGALLETYPLQPAEVAALIASVAEVLEHAHRRGVVHGNLHPQAILVPFTERRFPIVLGEWMQARTSDATPDIDRLPSLAARPYLAPEQRLGWKIEARTDIYALGVIAYQALFGMLPDPANPPVLVRGEPLMLAALIRQMMASDPARRPTAERLRDAIDAVLANLGRAAVEDPVEERSDEIVEILDDIERRRFVQISSDQAPEVMGEIG